jgi:hypothetical protein
MAKPLQNIHETKLVLFFYVLFNGRLYPLSYTFGMVADNFRERVVSCDSHIFFPRFFHSQ